MRAPADLDRLEDEKILLPAADLLRHDRLEVVVRESDLAISEVLEPRERAVDLRVFQRDPELLQGVDERVSSAVLAEDQSVPLQADLQRIHDLVGGPVREHTVLMDPALMRESAGAHD